MFLFHVRRNNAFFACHFKLLIARRQTKIFSHHQFSRGFNDRLRHVLRVRVLDSKNGPASDAKQRDPPRDEVRRESERTSSPRPQIAKQNRTRRRART
jgi:hypothetical protein